MLVLVGEFLLSDIFPIPPSRPAPSPPLLTSSRIVFLLDSYQTREVQPKGCGD